MIKVMGMISNMNDGGAQKVLLNQAKMFKNDDNIEFTIFSYEKPTNSIYDQIISREHINIKYLNKERHFCKIPIIGDFINFFITNANWYFAIKKYNPDVIHTHVTEILRKSFIGIKLSKVKKIFCTLHSNPYRYKGTSYWAARISFNVFGFVPVCITKDQADKAVEHYKLKKYIIVRNGIEFDKIKKSMISKEEARNYFNIKKDDFVIASVGRLEPIKNLKILLDAVKNIYNNNNNRVKLIIAGDGSEKDIFESYIKDNNLENIIILLGNLENVIPVYCAADLFCMPSISEASPMALHEAQFCDVDCIISNGVPTENVYSDKVSLVKDINSVDAWIKAINDKRGNTIIKKSNQNDFDYNYIKKQLKEIYMK